jgi:biotin carboxyl carrier protein
VSASAASAAAASAPAAASAKTVTAPIPGVIISVAVKAGESVSVGQELCVLEAMKMKNSIRANRAGKIAAVRVAPSDQVVRGTVLLEFGD